MEIHYEEQTRDRGGLQVGAGTCPNQTDYRTKVQFPNVFLFRSQASFLRVSFTFLRLCYATFLVRSSRPDLNLGILGGWRSTDA